jgi:hypothetical protein
MGFENVMAHREALRDKCLYPTTSRPLLIATVPPKGTADFFFGMRLVPSLIVSIPPNIAIHGNCIHLLKVPTPNSFSLKVSYLLNYSKRFANSLPRI